MRSRSASNAAFFGAKKGSEPVHVQVNLPDRTLAVINSLGTPIADARLRVRAFGLDGALLDDRTIPLAAAAYAVTPAGQAVPDAVLDRAPVVLVKLELRGSDGGLCVLPLLTKGFAGALQGCQLAAHVLRFLASAIYLAMRPVLQRPHVLGLGIAFGDQTFLALCCALLSGVEVSLQTRTACLQARALPAQIADLLLSHRRRDLGVGDVDEWKFRRHADRLRAARHVQLGVERKG